MVNKKAYLRTLEVMMAVLLTFIFVLYMLPNYITEPASEQSLDILNQIETNIRNCHNNTCVEDAIIAFEPDFDNRYDYIINVSSESNTAVSGLPDKKVFSDSIFISGNSTNYDPKVIRVYYWIR